MAEEKTEKQGTEERKPEAEKADARGKVKEGHLKAKTPEKGELGRPQPKPRPGPRTWQVPPVSRAFPKGGARGGVCSGYIQDRKENGGGSSCRCHEANRW